MQPCSTTSLAKPTVDFLGISAWARTKTAFFLDPPFALLTGHKWARKYGKEEGQRQRTGREVVNTSGSKFNLDVTMNSKDDGRPFCVSVWLIFSPGLRMTSCPAHRCLRGGKKKKKGCWWTTPWPSEGERRARKTERRKDLMMIGTIFIWYGLRKFTYQRTFIDMKGSEGMDNWLALLFTLYHWMCVYI